MNYLKRAPRLGFGVALCLLAGALSCKKGTDAVATRQCLLRSSDNSSSYGYTYGGLFEYNASRQPTRATLTSNGTYSTLTTQVQEFTYSAGQITMKVNPAPVNTGTLSATYLLNSAGYIAKTTTVSRVYTGTTTLRTDNQFYEYNADGYMTKRTASDGSYQVLDYTGGNLTLERDYNTSGGLTGTYTYTYYEDKPLTIATVGGVDEFAAFYAAGLYGKPIKNPIKQSVGSSGGTSSFTYTYDSDGNITSSKEVYTPKSGTAATTTTNYTYLCQ